ncbi:MFS transporter [Paenibacillus cellulositrophicus]|uniref:MFS transporter n=1 Tax=Paenibacillus cellulositrophicus TaxID=562959 RepID=UPI00203EE973|nr:MFS transporter [Paenibacillus cellulositrophicus]MCM2997987.1 MFS transporter [Paenibacillus cellulositrophicus]
MTTKKETILIFAFTFAAFVLGTTEYVIVGLLKDISVSLGVSLAAAGILVSSFAIAYAVGTPFAVSLLGRIPRHVTILSGYAALLVLNALTIFAGNFALMFVIRVITAILCGLTLSLTIAAASEHIQASRRAGAVAWIIGGFSIANVLGVPVGTYIGQLLGWRAAFIVTSAVGIIPLFIIASVLPKSDTVSVSSMKQQFALFANRRIRMAFLIPVLGVGSVFIVYTYITPILENVLGIPKQWTSAVLLGYGGLTILSNWIGAKVAEGDSRSKLKIVFIVQSLMMMALALTLSFTWAAVLCLMLIALFSYALSAAVQLYLIDLADASAGGSKDFASTLMPVASNLGIACGSLLGSLVVDSIGLAYLPWAALAFSIGAFAVTARCHQLDQEHLSIGTAARIHTM